MNPIRIDANNIFGNIIRKFLLKEKSFLFFKKINNRSPLNHDEIVVAIGIIINPN
tara:strand:- start:238 stop:402 length:165 start_codon:yes stop_codon:yes gene_type:complete